MYLDSSKALLEIITRNIDGLNNNITSLKLLIEYGTDYTYAQMNNNNIQYAIPKINRVANPKLLIQMANDDVMNNEHIINIIVRENPELIDQLTKFQRTLITQQTYNIIDINKDIYEMR